MQHDPAKSAGWAKAGSGERLEARQAKGQRRRGKAHPSPIAEPAKAYLPQPRRWASASRRLAHQHELAGQGYVAAPVLGNPDLAEARKLFVIVAGASPAVARVSPVLGRLGQRLFLLGDDPGAANLMKLAANALTALTLQSMGEVLALLRKGGVDAGAAFEVLTGSLFDGKVHKTYGGKIVESHYSPPGMTTPLAVKDLRLALAEAEHMAVPMPATCLVHDRLVATVARGWTELDWSALGLLAACDAGLPSDIRVCSRPAE
jgi:3-hydroxyisobutyrate dehydrogenase-like beta-hydroxyacid dehydrogenase